MSPENQRRLRQLTAATAVLVLHVVFIGVLLNLRVHVPAFGEKPGAQIVTWIALPASPPEPGKEAEEKQQSVAPANPAIPVEKERQRTLEPPAAITLPSPPADAAILETLGQYFSCNPMAYEKISAPQKERCRERLAELGNEPQPAYMQSAHEQQLTQKFAHELAVKRSPPLLPCFSPERAAITHRVVLCLLDGAINGFDLDRLPSYADVADGGRK